MMNEFLKNIGCEIFQGYYFAKPMEINVYSGERILDVIRQITGARNRAVNESQPIVDARLENGDRVHVVLPPVAVNGPIITIRRFPKEPMTMKRLLEMDSISQEEIDFLADAVRAGYSILVAGGTGSGKTTFLKHFLFRILSLQVSGSSGDHGRYRSMISGCSR